MEVKECCRGRGVGGSRSKSVIVVGGRKGRAEERLVRKVSWRGLGFGAG